MTKSILTNKPREIKSIGQVGVDTARLLIIDPCYLDQLPDDADIGPDEYNFSKQLNFPAGHSGLGVVVSTGWGDGTYEVEAETFQDDDGFTRVRKITIQFA